MQFKRFLSAALALLCVLFSFAGCEIILDQTIDFRVDQSDAPETSTPSDTTTRNWWYESAGPQDESSILPDDGETDSPRPDDTTPSESDDPTDPPIDDTESTAPDADISTEEADTSTEEPDTDTKEPDTDTEKPDTSSEKPGTSIPELPDNDPPIKTGSLAVHFIDVGQADAALIICDGKTMLIDGGNKDDSNLIYAYLEKHGVTHLDYVVATHAHEDHVGGLAGALTYATVGTVYSPVTTYSTQAFRNFVSKVSARGKTLTVPTAGETFSLGSAHVTIIGPVKAYDDPNNTSIVLRLVYGEISFLFTGDMESDAETDLIESGAELQSTVLKVGHHGSGTSSSYRFLREVAPTYGVISVGKDNSYGHPHENVLSRYRDAEVQLFRTDMQGDIICTSTDGVNLTFTTARNADAVTNPT